MAERWERTSIRDNADQPLTVWSWRSYELACEVNLGLEGGWSFELSKQRRRVGIFADLVAGQSAAERIEADRARAASTDTLTLHEVP